nr:uncharacterized protein LOC117278794 [Nicotiana tomentosiformis]
MASYSWTRLSGYSAKAAPLTELLKKNKPWVWTEHCQREFEDLKATVIEEPVLALPDLAKTFEVHTYASDFAIGGVLMQDNHPIAFESLKLNETERRYTPDKANVIADALSRKAELAKITSTRWDIHEAIKEGMQHDPTAKQLIDLAKQGSTRHFWVEDGLLLTTGQHRTRALVESVYFWPRTRDDIECYVQTYLVCQEDKVEKQQPGGLLEPLPVTESPWKSVTMDFITYLPKSDNYGTILVVVDRFSKYATFMHASLGCTAKEAAKLFFKNVVKYWRLPRHIISDRDPRFTGNLWR